MTRPAPQYSGLLHTARSLALSILRDAHRGDAYVQELLDAALGQSLLSAADRRLTAHLVYGVLRRRATLDALLRPFIDRPLYRVEPWLWDILRLGAFQLALMTHIPPHAAVNETVRLAEEYRRPKAKGFLNGVLRALERLLTDERLTAPAADALPLEDGQYRRLARPVLPDPATDRVEYLAAGLSLPAWLAERWLKRSSWEECLRLGFWFAGPASLWLRCNRLRTDRATFLTALEQAGIRAEAGDYPDAVRLADSVPIRELPGYAEGWFTVQDASAMRVAAALEPRHGGAVLDLCAAPGGKTTHLAELMANEGRIVACDVNGRRLRVVADLCRRLGVAIVEPRLLNMKRQEEPPAGPFDAVLVDVPCSNTGVLGRRPEVRWRLRPDDFRRLVPLQTKLLLQAAERVKPGGAVVYSTCSIEPEENRQVVRAVLRALPWLVPEAEEEQVPGRPADGGYWARVRRKEEGGKR